MIYEIKEGKGIIRVYFNIDQLKYEKGYTKGRNNSKR